MWKHIFGWQIGKCSSGSNTVYTKNTHGSDVNGSQKVLGEASLRWVNTNREKICQLRTGEAFHCIWFFQILSKIFKLSSRLNLPVMSGSFVVMGGRHLVDIIGDISWTKGVTSHGHFWRHLVDTFVLFLGDFLWTIFGWYFVDNFWVYSFEHSSSNKLTQT